jgi:hypothetical protein
VNVRSLIAALLLVVLGAACGRAGAQNPTPAGGAVPTHVFRTVVPSLSTVPAPCPSSTTAGGTPVTLFVAPGGGCIRPDQLRQFGCSDQVDPMIEAAGLRFLGGTFSMVVSGVPDDAALVGRGGGEDVYVVPGDRPTLYVAADGRVQRWLTVGSPPAGAPRALFVGDSITVGSRGAIVRALPGWETGFHAAVGRTTDQGTAAARTVRDMGNVDVVVVELGTNEGTAEGFPVRIQQMLSVVGGARLVVWVTVHRDLPIVPELNDDIVAAMRSIPNGTIADWNGAVTAEDLVGDGVHPTDRGKELMAGLLRRPLTRWADAATGAGAAACAPPPPS